MLAVYDKDEGWIIDGYQYWLTAVLSTILSSNSMDTASRAIQGAER